MRRGIVPSKAWPDCVQGHPKLRGIFTGGCVRRGVGSSFRAKAHAHIQDDGWFGWICVRKAERLSDRALMLHELAHILTERGHDDTFRARLLELGGTIDSTDSLRSYAKVER